MSDSKEKDAIIEDDANSLLATATNAVEFPVLAAALAGPQGAELRHELVRLVAPQLHLRAPRRYLRVLCRLEGVAYDEPVLLTDISVTGVRFLVLTDVPLDVTHFGNMRLHVKTKGGARTLAVALVRRCGGDERHTDVACRFLETDADHAQLVAEIRSVIFGAGHPTPAG